MPSFFPPFHSPPGHYPPHIRPPYNPFRVFYAITGISLFAFISGFSVCLFDLNQIEACVDYAEGAVRIFRMVGDHIISWFLALVEEIFSRR